MAAPSVLVVDDEEDILELVEYTLTREGFQVSCVNSGEKAVAAIRSQRPDVVVLDLMLPGQSGLDICRTIKNSSDLKNTSVVMLSAKGDETDIVLGLELGADDYVTKPFSPKVLVARVRAVVRRRAAPPPTEENLLTIGELRIDSSRHEVHLGTELLDLTATEFRLLRYLAVNRGKVFTRLQIVHAVHGTDYPVTDRSVDVQIVGLRRKLGEYGNKIDTVRGVGYRFTDGDARPEGEE